jgi:hypothetical protein
MDPDDSAIEIQERSATVPADERTVGDNQLSILRKDSAKANHGGRPALISPWMPEDQDTTVLPLRIRQVPSPETAIPELDCPHRLH